MSVLTTRALRKDYGPVRAVDHVDLDVAQGSIYGFIGRNGAGKSTTIRMVLGLVAPSGGTVELFGERVHPGATHLWGRVGHLVETATAWPELTVRENLEVARALYGVSDPVDALVERLRLAPYADRRARHLSRGNLQRLALARALLPQPELLVLDEPTNGLDPAGVIEIRELLRTLARGGVTIFMSSHHLAEVDRLATRVGIVHEGRLIEELDAAELEARRAQHLEVVTTDLEGAEAVLRAAGRVPQRGRHLDGRPLLTLDDPRSVAEPAAVARLLVAADHPPSHLAVVHEDLEHHFIRLTGGTP